MKGRRFPNRDCCSGSNRASELQAIPPLLGECRWEQPEFAVEIPAALGLSRGAKDLDRGGIAVKIGRTDEIEAVGNRRKDGF